MKSLQQLGLEQLFDVVVVNKAQTLIAEYLASTVDPETFQGSISFSNIIFHSEYLELGVISSFKDNEEEEYKDRTQKILPEVTDEEGTAVEILFDENIINTGLHSAFHTDGEFTLRDVLGTEDPDNEYSEMFKAVLLTNVVGQGWKEIETEYGRDRR